MNATFALIISCFLIYGICMVIASSGIVSADYIVNEFGFSGANAFAKPWTFLTAAFIHADIGHLLSNMFALIFFGASVENELGKKRMLLIFFLGVVGGNALSMLFYAPDIILIGASAGVFALIGTGMFVRPVDMSFYPFTAPMPLGIIGIIYALYNSLGILAGDVGVSYIAHAGGMLVGIVFGIRREGLRRSMLWMVALIFAILLLPLIFSFLKIF